MGLRKVWCERISVVTMQSERATKIPAPTKGTGYARGA
jgi:hypothetical protein